MICLLLAGCQSRNADMDMLLAFRQSLLAAKGCSFRAVIQADYGENVYHFTVDCQVGETGDLTFRVVEPESIAGIAGVFRAEGGSLTFDDAVLAFPTLADGEVTPVSAPWLLYRTLLSGAIATVGREQDLLRATIYENYGSNPLQLDVWFQEDRLPCQAQILWQGRRVLEIAVENFRIL